MRVLALDTTTRRGSVALVDGNRVVAEHEGDATRTHAERLPRELLEVLRVAGAALDSVDVFAVAAGPGSFTGLRIGIAAIQGLAVVTGRPVVPISLLDALGHVGGCHRSAGTLVGAWIDAHRGDVFASLYRLGETADHGGLGVAPVDGPRVDRPDVVLRDWQERTGMPEAVAGDGAVLYREMIGAASAVIAPPAMAGVIGRLAAARAGTAAAVSPAAVQPVYVRRPDAEIAREQKL